LSEGESFNIVAFYGRTQRFHPQLVPATPQNVARGKGFLESLQLDKGTNLEKAMQQSFAARGANVMVVITDGVPTYGERNFDKLAQRIRALNKNRARIFSVGLVGRNPDGTDNSFEAARLLQQIARDSNGAYRQVTVGEAGPQESAPPAP
jgi:Mg-chelatase subunit ChlD